MNFQLKHTSELSIQDLEIHNTWAEYYSADELEYIVKEGYVKQEVEECLVNVNWSDGYLFKSYHSSITTPYMFTRFFAEFELQDKRIIKGYIEFTEYSGTQSYCLFVSGGFIALNVQEPEMTREEEIQLKRKLNINDLYPFKVKSSDNRFNIDKYLPEN